MVNTFTRFCLSNLSVSTGFVSLYGTFCIILNTQIDLGIFFMLFFGCFGVYGVHRLSPNFALKRPFFQKQNTKAYLSLSFVLASAVIFLMRYFSWWCLPVLMINLFYHVSFMGFSFRGIPYLKIFCIAFSWTFLIVFFSIERYTTEIFWISAGGFTFVFAITLPFDKRDKKTDNVKTLAHLWRKYLPFCSCFLLLILGIFVAIYLQGQRFVLVGIGLYIVLVLFNAKKMPHWYYWGILDVSMSVFPISYYLLK